MPDKENKLIADILEVFRSNPDRRYKSEQIEDILRMHGASAFKRVVKSLAVLEGESKITLTNKDEFKMATPETVVEGTFKGNDKGFGFVRYDEVDPDAFISRDNTLHAVNGDTVEVKITKPSNPWIDKGPEGEITKIVERSLTKAVGEFHPYSDSQVEKTGHYGYVQSHEKKIAAYMIFISDKGLHPQMGDMVQVSIDEYPNDKHPQSMEGTALEIIGNKNDPGVDIMSIVVDNDINPEFPNEVLKEAESIPDHVLDSDRVGRKDLTKNMVITIDGDDSKDFDDAVGLDMLPNGNFHLEVDIADVTHYVKEGSPLDEEAYARGTSTYLVDRVIPMLPFRLSNGICSLNPGEDRLALTCEMEIDHSGNVVKHEIYPSVIQSKYRMTYNNVNEILKGDEELNEEYAPLVPMLKQMAQLHEILFNKRHQRGAIDFEETEAQIIVDENGKPIDIKLRERGTSEKMIESFMLAANETVAEHYNVKHVPFLYRVHEKPDEEKIKNFFEFAAAMGVQVKGNLKEITPKMFQNVLADVVGTPEEQVVTIMLLRSLQQARYSDEPLGHFGLAAKYYTHFTSPIRRYPDLTVHRMIHSYAEHGFTDDEQAKWSNKLQEIAEHTSSRERISINAERAVDDLKKTEYMADQVGNTFDAVVSSVTSFGMFIQLDNTVEGLIHISNMKDDFYEFDEKSMSMHGRGTGKIFKVGQPIKVKLIRADVEHRQIDFERVLTPEEQEQADKREAEFKKKRSMQHGRGRGGHGRHNDHKGHGNGRNRNSNNNGNKNHKRRGKYERR
ncbi:ribonuclease R [Companilactobacillus pabuli]|uniref:Ribonuclease R n=1 Tax=Companilactobacillus pabuli TaxID=2714036 RepID=A0A7L7KUW4_9LACO|nr:ribonuclease R [Companilactobacillus pabuli]AKP03502.1 ribonuclease R [Companilactobacillus farciminis]AKS51805.1 ribonuclease R [Companilactobacillus farciminis]MDG5112628.1 ribonuclease R [Companilactobacillus pabuli]QMT83590.1 ribonuclease R [Companilactobacillus pabuli]